MTHVRCSIAAVAMCVVAAPSLAEHGARLAVQIDRPGPRVSPMLYGVFFEEINLAGDGGLYAELVRNRSFEDSDKPDHWVLLTTNTAKGEMGIDTERPISERNRRSLRLKVSEVASGKVGAVNNGYWGIPVHEGRSYELSLFIRCGEGFGGSVTAVLESSDGKSSYASASVGEVNEEWTRKTLLLPPVRKTDPKARLAIYISKPGMIWLDVVSLFPRQTWKGRLNGLRPDLAEMLVGLRPSFVRFPGGCWVEGDTLQFATRWKRTIGDMSERWNQYNIWQYLSTNGLGFHEYLLMCEDLDAEPLFVINCGMSHRENVPMDKMAEWVQDALDAIEYCNGSAESQWGSVRAKAGHPAPFHLKYMEIGNENGGAAYQERYALFYDAIKGKYPDIKLIANVPTDRRPADIVDEHYYSNPEFFITNANKYDAYDRKGPKIYVGEYAVTQNCGSGNLRGAIGEAAFMTGMERNSDVVVMASYAPLLANVNYKKWNPDLINFDGTRVYGTPSYYVQKMFSENRVDLILPTTVEVLDAHPQEVKRGAIGVGTWHTQAEFIDIRVTQSDRVLFESDFSKGATGWRMFRGDWRAEQGALRQTDSGEDRRAIAGDPTWSDYTYSLKARKLGGAEGFLILFQVEDDANWVWWNLGGWGNVRHGIERCVAGGKGIIGNEVPGKIETGRWYDVRVEVKGPDIRCYLDGKLLCQARHQPVNPLYAVAGQATPTGEIVIKVVNVTKTAYKTQIELSGVEQVEPSGTAIVLTSASLEDENTLDQPARVAPVRRTVTRLSSGFDHTFQPHSLTILRLTVKQ